MSDTSETAPARLCIRCSDPVRDDEDVAHADCCEPASVTTRSTAEPLALYLDATTATVRSEPTRAFTDGTVYVAAQRLAEAIEDQLRSVPRPARLHDDETER